MAALQAIARVLAAGHVARIATEPKSGVDGAAYLHRADKAGCVFSICYQHK